MLKTKNYFLLLLLLLQWSRRSSRKKPNVQSPQTKSSKIWEVARNYRGSSKWRVWSSWGWRLHYFGKNKCNLFVYDVLIEAGAKAPNRKFVSLNPYTYLVNRFFNSLCNNAIIFQKYFKRLKNPTSCKCYCIPSEICKYLKEYNGDFM